MYIKRILSQQIVEASKDFKVVLVTGPRQVGKTTLLKKLAEADRSYVTLDDLDVRLAAKEDPKAFIENLKLPVLIDEVQYAPNLFPYIKMKVDSDQICGQFWLTGSDQFAMMKDVSESLAGRVAILEMLGISLAEEQNIERASYFLPSKENMFARRELFSCKEDFNIFHRIWRGSYPDVVTRGGKNWERFYSSYLTSYIERDVRNYLNIQNLFLFRKFMQIAASRTSSMVNYANMSQDLGVSIPTVKTWINLLQASGHVTMIRPYFTNHTSRAIKTPKLHFLDTGLCCYLTGWLNDDVLEKGGMSGPIFESYVVSEIIKSYKNKGIEPQLFYYGDKERNEIDLIIEKSGTLHPIEIKKAATVSNIKFKGFSFFEKHHNNVGHGALVCQTDQIIKVKDKVDAFPVKWI